MNTKNIIRPIRDILIVDDSFDVRAMIKEILRSKNIINVDETKDEQSAIEKLDKFYYKLIFLDIELDSGSGLTVLEKLKHDYPKTKVIMISGYNTPENVRKAIVHGADGFVAKPFTPAKIMSVLSSNEMA